MTEKLDNSMIRQLSDDELRAVSGAKPMEREAGRHTTVDWGWIRWQTNNKNGCWVAVMGEGSGQVSFAGCPGGKVTTFP